MIKLLSIKNDDVMKGNDFDCSLLITEIKKLFDKNDLKHIVRE